MRNINRYVSYVMDVATPTADCLTLVYDLLMPVVMKGHSKSTLSHQEVHIKLLFWRVYMIFYFDNGINYVDTIVIVSIALFIHLLLSYSHLLLSLLAGHISSNPVTECLSEPDFRRNQGSNRTNSLSSF